MTLQLAPDLWDADDGGFHSADQDDLSLNESFTDVLKSLVHGQFTPDEAVMLWGERCTSFARQASAVAQGLDYSTQARLQEEVRELCDEANTWSLLKHTFCRCALSPPVSPPMHTSLSRQSIAQISHCLQLGYQGRAISCSSSCQPSRWQWEHECTAGALAVLGFTGRGAPSSCTANILA